MYFAVLLRHAAQPTFGRNAAQFKELITFLATVSLVLWACVLATMLFRIVMCHVWYRHRSLLPSHDLPPA